MSTVTAEPGSIPLFGIKEEFALCMADGKSAAEAYRVTHPKVTNATAETNGPKMHRDTQVALRVKFLQKKVEDKVTDEFAWDKVDTLKWCLEIAQTPIGKVDQDHPLCQEYSRTDGNDSTTVRYKMPAKLEAMEKIIKIRGWYEPDKVQHSGSITLTTDDQIAETRSKKRLTRSRP